MSIFKKKQEKIVGKKEYLITENVPFGVQEAFRNLKASLAVSIPKKATKEGQAVLITSPCPEAGKTTVAVNLALMFAQSKAKVLLIDADVRKGRVARYFHCKSAPGLADLLSGQATLEDVLHDFDKAKNFHYITCGTHSPRPYELFESDAMKSLLSELKKQYDYIVIDTPPVLLLSDALALIPETDGTVVVCRHMVSHVGDIAKTLDTLSFAKANVLGVVVNDYRPREKTTKYTYGKYDYYAYGGYEYTASESEAEEEVAQTNA
ncbi:MAG: CpsD/CapB family tyrosine-protein kinase [Clostridia bacterium]|nr:CpsD/CapB family tyrosine-protein kinase [Clostridia bacterium]